MRQSSDHRHRACGLGLRVKLGPAASNLEAWAEQVRMKRYFRLSCARALAYRRQKRRYVILVSWLALAQHSAHSGFFFVHVD